MSNTNANNVDQIREIIFGSQMKDFEEKFSAFENEMKKSEEKLQKMFESAHTTLQKETERALEALEKKIDNLASTTQRERTKLKELIDTTEENLLENMTQQKDEFDTKMKIAKENSADEHQKLQELMASMQQDLTELLHTQTSQLADDKLSRDAMSQMLLDMAMKIQGADSNPLTAMMAAEASQPEDDNAGNA